MFPSHNHTIRRNGKQQSREDIMPRVFQSQNTSSVASLQAILLSSIFEQSRDNFSYLPGKKRRYRVSDLSVLVTQVAAEKVIVRESLQTGHLPGRQTSALEGVRVDVVVPVFGDMTRNRCCRLIFNLHSEAVRKITVVQCVCDTPMIRQQARRKI